MMLHKLHQLFSGTMLLLLGLLGIEGLLPNTAQGAATTEHFAVTQQEGMKQDSTKQDEVSGCPPSVLEQSISHPVQPGETLASIAESYNLLPASIVSLNPSLQSTSLTGSDRIIIPPHNGTLYEVVPGSTWQTLGDTYGIRADVLFESNGCGPTPPSTVFVPGIGTRVQSQEAYTLPSDPQVFRLFPIPQDEEIESTLGYGWQQPSTNEPPLFHSGMDWSAPLGTPVQSVGDGTIAFAGEKGDYGILIVINHDQGVQTRYAQLSTTQVSVGEVVTAGTIIGLSGESGTATLPHLHFEVRLNSNSGWIAQDPLLYLAP